MATRHIEITATASRLGADTRALIDSARRLYQDSDRVKNIADEVMFGNDWAALALKWGCTVAEAETAYGLLVAFRSALNVADVKAFINRLG